MDTILNYFGIGGFVIILLSVFIEIVPIKLHPLRWLGKCINKDMFEAVTRTEKKLDEHIAQSYRNKILNFQDKLLSGGRFTLEEWNEVLSSCDLYEKYIEDNNLVNGKANLAIEYVKHMYKKALDNSDFINISQDLMAAAILLNKKERIK